MEIIKYSDMVRNLSKPGEDILKEMTPSQAEALHMALGVAGEAGELADAVKRNSVYQKPLDRKNVVEEFGDIEFFLERLRQLYGISREETIQGNKNKLKTRFPGTAYSNQAAQERADKDKGG